jgi:zinc protease
MLDTAGRGPIARFYHDWYRPDLMAVIVVGDIDARAIEREIIQRFGDIPTPAKARPRPASTLPVARETVVDVYRGRVTPSVEVLWPVAPAPKEPEAILERRLVEQLLLGSLDRRFLRMRELESRPFVVTNIERGALVRPLEVVGFELVAWPDSLERGLATVLAEFERIAQHGIPEATLKRQKAALLAQLESEAASSSARPSKAYADAYAQHFLTGEGLLVSPEQTLALARTILSGITSARVAAAARFWRSAEGRKVLVRLPENTHVRPPTRESVLAIFDSVAKSTLAPQDSRTLADGPLLDAPPIPGRIVKETRHAAAGIIEWTLSNGARVLFKPSGNDPDELLLRAWSPGGFSRVPDSLFYGTGRMVARMMTEAAGLGTHDRDDLTAQLATTGVRQLTVDIGYGDESIALAASPRDLETLFEMLYLQFTAPRLDSAALAGWKNYAKYEGRAFSIFDQLNQTFARGNVRMMPVSTQLADLADLDDAMAVYRDRFGNAGDFTFTIVGASTPAQVRPLVERYIASLPATAERETPKDPAVRPFMAIVRKTVHPYDIPKASTLLVFDGLFSTEPEAYLTERQRLAALTDVLTRRLRDRLREQLGATYTVTVLDRTYPLPKEHYQLLVAFDAAPDRMRAMQREVRAILDSVRQGGATESELARVAAAQHRMLEVQLQNNGYWMQRIGLFDRLGIPLDRIPKPYGSEQLTPGALQAAATRYLPRDVYIQVTAMPQDSTLETLAAKDTVSTNSAKVGRGDR